MEWFTDADLIRFDFRSVKGPREREEIDVVAERLLDGKVCHIVLEPGDATRYEFYLIPFWNEEMKPIGYNDFDASRYMLLGQLNLQQRTVQVELSRKIETVRYSGGLDQIDGYTAEFLAQYIVLLAEMVYKIGTRRAEAFGRLDRITRGLKKEDRDGSTD